MPNAVSVQRTRSASGVPSNSLGKDGDMYIDTATRKFYFKSAGAYAVSGQLASAISNIGVTFVCPDSTPRDAALSN